MAFVQTWDYESSPVGTDAVSVIDNKMRGLAYAIRERLAVDHNYHADESGESNIGAHDQVSLLTRTAPSALADAIRVYGKDVGGKCELHVIDEDGNEKQLTSGGKMGSATTNFLALAITVSGTVTVDVATGTAPLTIASTTKVTNLNADLLDGSHASTTTGSAIIPIANASGYLPDASVDTTALKTATGDVSTTAQANLTLPGGEYGFYPQLKGFFSQTDYIPGAVFTQQQTLASYTSAIFLHPGGGTVYAQQRYITASGEDMWIFLLVDKITKEIISAYSAPDAPHYGNSGDYNKVPHPFGSYNPETQEIILIDKETVNLIKSQATEKRSILTIVNEDMKVDYATEKVYEPLHSGKFLTKDGKQVAEMVMEIAPYIKVKSLQKMTAQELQEKENKRQLAMQKVEQEKTQKQQKLNALKQKLNLTNEELELLKR